MRTLKNSVCRQTTSLDASAKPRKMRVHISSSIVRLLDPDMA